MTKSPCGVSEVKPTIFKSKQQKFLHTILRYLSEYIIKIFSLIAYKTSELIRFNYDCNEVYDLTAREPQISMYDNQLRNNI